MAKKIYNSRFKAKLYTYTKIQYSELDKCLRYVSNNNDYLFAESRRKRK